VRRCVAGWEKERLSQLFYRYPELGRAWILKESFRAWHRETDRRMAEERLEMLEKMVFQPVKQAICVKDFVF